MAGESPPSLSPSVKLAKKASLKLQKQSYRIEKKKAENEFLTTINNPAFAILSDWLKIRSTLKNWTRMWCVLKPGMLIVYKNSKQKQWIGTLLLASVEIIERPSKKAGFCFKIYHALDQCVWALKGPKGETTSFLSHSLPSNHLILRVSSESDGQCWMDALELSKKCSNLLKKSLDTNRKVSEKDEGKDPSEDVNILGDFSTADNALKICDTNGDVQSKVSTFRSESVTSGHSYADSTFTQHSEDTISENEKGLQTFADASQTSSAESFDSDDVSRLEVDADSGPQSTFYVQEELDDISAVGEDCQSEVLQGENKSLLWMLLKQVRPGMDLSKVVLPTFILEPRSFLDKLADYYYHADLISKATEIENAYERIKAVTKWYLSGFYKKPKGLKKPYNPILGETFRCKWNHAHTGSQTFYLAEQVSHHPPVSAFVVSNRKDGFVVQGSILAKSKFYGNSVSAVLDGNAKVLLLKHGEEYCVTMPYAHCKGIIYGKMTMEFGGKVTIVCDKTGYLTELEFKLKPMFGGNSKLNEICGRILLGQHVLATISGHWDQTVFITDLNKGTVDEFWSPTDEVKRSRLQRYMVDMSQQGDFESNKLWRLVTQAINNQDQVTATEQKSVLEDAQRQRAKLLHESGQQWKPKYFEFDCSEQEWIYKYLDTRPWDSMIDIMQYESCGVIATETKHKSSLEKSASHRLKTSDSRAKDKTSRKSMKSNDTDSLASGRSSRRQNKPWFEKVNRELLAEALQPVIQNQEIIRRKIDQAVMQLQLANRNIHDNSFPWNVIAIVSLLSVGICQLYLGFTR